MVDFVTWDRVYIGMQGRIRIIRQKKMSYLLCKSKKIVFKPGVNICSRFFDKE